MNRLIAAAVTAILLPAAAWAQDAATTTTTTETTTTIGDMAAPAPMADAGMAAGTLPTCGPGVADKCQQSPAAEAMAASEYKGGGKDNSAMMTPRRDKRRS